ncbi:TlpA family protein disulfide reductase [bacterium]|nr:TlpA family protein disulfide reductase [bacterium]
MPLSVRNVFAGRLTAIALIAAAVVLQLAAKSGRLYSDVELLPEAALAPSFALAGLDGNKVRLNELRGRVVWIVFGSTAEPDSVIQLREAGSMAASLGDADLSVLFLAQSQPKDEVQAYVEQFGSPAAMLFDNGSKVSARYRVNEFPTSYLIGKSGHVQEAWQGVWRAGNRDLRRKLKSLLESGRRPGGAGD